MQGAVDVDVVSQEDGNRDGGENSQSWRNNNSVGVADEVFQTL